MIKNYLRTACRNFLRHRLYSTITVLGLTIGLTVGMLVLLWVQDETSFDAFHRKAADIYRVNSAVGMGVSREMWNTTQAPVAVYALKEIPGVVDAARIADDYDYSIYSWKDKLFDKVNAVYTDPAFFAVFDFKLLRGDVRRPWPDNQSVLVTERMARKYFGSQDPVGKVIQGDHKDNFRISGVVADIPENSSIRADLFFPMARVEEQYQQAVDAYAKTVPPGTFYWHSLNSDWGNFGYTTFLQVQPGVDVQQIGRRLIAIQKREAPGIKVSLTENAYRLQPLTTIHLREADGKAPGMQTVRIFLVVAIFILLIASINYVNLSTARAMLRAREVSVRKIIGAARRQLFVQFMVESVLFYLVSLVLALGLIGLLIPYYNTLAGKHFELRFDDPGIWKVVGFSSLGTLLASAVYPALLLSSFEPLKALKGTVVLNRRRFGDAIFRKVLVTTQFVFSVGLMIGTLVIGRQLSYIRDLDPGYDRSQVLILRGEWVRQHADAVRSELSHVPAVKGVATSNVDLVDADNTTGDTDWDGKTPNSMFVIKPMEVDEHFIPLMKMKLVAGANFTGEATDSMHFILNETAVRLTGIKDPIGKRFKLHNVDGTIIGVVRDFNYASMREQIAPAILSYQKAAPELYVKTTGTEAPRAIAALRRLAAAYHPGFPFDYSFLDQRFEALYRADQRTDVLFRFFAGIAIFISCLGLFGLASYTAEVRTREIGIRKVLGASVGSIVRLLSRDFLRLVFVAILIASPLAWLYMYSWLQDFVYRITIGWWVFLLAGAAAILLAVLTICGQSIRAAMANPVKSLRHD